MRRNRLIITAALLSLFLVVGCHEYSVEVRVDPDGGGARVVTYAPQISEEFSEEEMLGVFQVAEDQGWERREERDGENVTVRYVRSSEVASPDGWADLGGDIHLLSSAYTGSGSPRSHPTRLLNSISLETGRSEEGRTYTYRETLRWTGLKEDLSEILANEFERHARKRCPELDGPAATDLRDAFRSNLLATWNRTSLTEDEDAFVAALTHVFMPEAAAILQRNGCGYTQEDVSTLVAAAVGDEDSQVEDVLERDMLGVSMAIITSLKLTVHMPGEILDTNGEIEAEGEVSWSLGLLDPLDRDVELVVRSLVRN